MLFNAVAEILKLSAAVFDVAAVNAFKLVFVCGKKLFNAKAFAAEGDSAVGSSLT